MKKKIAVLAVLACVSACAGNTSAVKPTAPASPVSSDIAIQVDWACKRFVERHSRWVMEVKEPEPGSKNQRSVTLMDRTASAFIEVSVYDAAEVSPVLATLFVKQLMAHNHVASSDIAISDENGTAASVTFMGKAPDGHPFGGTVIAQIVGKNREKTVMIASFWPATLAAEMSAATDDLAKSLGLIGK